jgi:chemotaxis protein histidine kinase CheA
MGFGPCAEPDRQVVHLGPAAGWLPTAGLVQWTREVGVCLRGDLRSDVLARIEGVLPEVQIDEAEHPHAKRAASQAPVLAVTPAISDRLLEAGVRVHTIGFDRVSGGFYYLAMGGPTPELRVQGDLFAAVRHALVGKESASDLERCLDGLIDRLLAHFTTDALSEHAVELAAALPPLRTRTEPRVDTAQLEASIVAHLGNARSALPPADGLQDRFIAAAAQGEKALRLDPWGRFERVVQPTLAVELTEGTEGKGRFFVLPDRARWLWVGPAAEVPAEHVVGEVAARKRAAAEKAAAEKAAAEKAARERAAAEKAAAEKAAREKAAAEKAAAEKAAREKAAAEKAAAEKTAAEKAAAEKAAAEKAAAEKAAREKAAAEKAAAEKAAAEKAAREKAAAEKAAAEKAAAEKAAAEKAAAEKAAAEKAAREKAAAEKAAAEKAAAEKAAAEKAAAEKAAAEKNTGHAQVSPAPAEEADDLDDGSGDEDVVEREAPARHARKSGPSYALIAVIAVVALVLLAIGIYLRK